MKWNKEKKFIYEKWNVKKSKHQTAYYTTVTTTIWRRGRKSILAKVTHSIRRMYKCCCCWCRVLPSVLVESVFCSKNGCIPTVFLCYMRIIIIIVWFLVDSFSFQRAAQHLSMMMLLSSSSSSSPLLLYVLPQS